MSAPSRGRALLLWQLKAAFRLLCFLATSVGETMVALATTFRACGRASTDYGLLVIPVQMVLLLAWVPTRLLFILLFSAVKTTHRADIWLRGPIPAAR